jgi:hypothetical protein
VVTLPAYLHVGATLKECNITLLKVNLPILIQHVWSPTHDGNRLVSVCIWGGRSGYPKFSGRVIRVFKISGFENRYPKLQRVLQYPKIRVPGISGSSSGSGIPELPELLCRLHKNTYTLLN